MIELSANQYNMVANVFSFTVAAMAIAALFFLVQRSEVLPRYRAGVALLGLIALVTGYNYVRLLQSWQDAYKVVGGTLRSTGIPYSESLRYSDWLLTLPLLLVALVLVLDLKKQQARLRSLVLVLLAAEMVVLGFPSQGSTDLASRWMWWGISLVPYTLILFQLYGSLGAAVKAQPSDARKLAGAARFLILVTLLAYPAIYVLPLVGVTGATATMVTQIGFAAADLVVGGLCTILIYMVASSKTLPEKELAGAAPASAFRGLKV